jgi:GT2 family glycosyltransferase
MDGATTLPRLAVILLNWNQPEFTLACLKSLEKLDYPAYDVVVLDNGSHDGSVAAIRNEYPHLTLIENGSNLGFAAGCNVGIWHALDHGADYVLLLNTDTEVAPDLLQRLVEAGESDPLIGALGAKIYYYDHHNVIWSAGGTVDKYGRARHLCESQVDDGAECDIRDVDYVTGCAILVKRNVIKTVGAMDERFFTYFEETEWCARIRKAGFRVVYVPQARLWHKIQMAARASSRRYWYMMTRNRLLYLHCTGASLVTIFGAIGDILRTTTTWTLLPIHKPLRPYRGALLRGVVDFMLGRFGAPRVYA